MEEISGWNAWAKQVANEIEKVMRGVERNCTDTIEIKEQLAGLQEVVNRILSEQKDISAIRQDIAKLQVKAAVWGLLSGVVPVAIAILFKLFD